MTARAVDLNTLPTVAIERIEVLRDGASAIYGTDAIAGVINIITRKEYEGISVAADGKWPQGGGGDSYGANIVGGYGSLATDGWNVYGGFSYTKQKVLNATDRDYSATGVIPSKGMAKSSGTTFPATWFQFDPNSGDLNATANPSAAAGCAPPTPSELQRGMSLQLCGPGRPDPRAGTVVVPGTRFTRAGQEQHAVARVLPRARTS